jgi:membrane protease YdiL (CAAX protease family)
MSFQSNWLRVPVIFRAILSGGLMAVAGTVPWALLVWANIKYGPSIPWAVVPTAIYLWIYWRFANGKTKPASTAETRRKFARTDSPGEEIMGLAIVSGILGLITMVLFQNVFNRMVHLPQHPMDDLSRLSYFSIFCFMIMSAIVAGVTEEISFRGYMQGPIERRHGPVLAILITGSLFGFAHFTHPETTLALMPFYLSVAIIYGTIAWLTHSTRPGIFLHAGGNIFASFTLLTQGRTEWQTPAKPLPLIWESGTDTTFWFSVAATIIFFIITVMSYRALGKMARGVQQSLKTD